MELVIITLVILLHLDILHVTYVWIIVLTVAMVNTVILVKKDS
jgi:hypothetical protein